MVPRPPGGKRACILRVSAVGLPTVARMDPNEKQPKQSEVIYAHSRDAGPVVALKAALLHTSIGQLKSHDHYERYLALVDPTVPERIMSTLAMSWIPIELSLAHYQACDNLMLSVEAINGLGTDVGDRMQLTSLAASARSTDERNDAIWEHVGALHRMWARHYQGGSVRVVKLGPHDMQLEQRGFVLNQFRYYRCAQLAAIGVSFEAVGAHVTTLRILDYSAPRDELVMNIGWA